MKFKLKGLTTQNETINLPNPIWFEFLINNFGANVLYRFFFLKPIPDKITLVKVYLNNEHSQIFMVDRVCENIQNKKNRISTFELVLSSPINLIWQNYVQPETFEQLSINTLFEKFCKPFSIKSILPDLLNSPPTNFITNLGMTCWDVVCLFFKKVFNVTVFVNQNKQLTTKFIPEHAVQLNTNNPNLTMFKSIIDRTKLISTIMVQLPDDDSNTFLKLKQNSNIISEQLKINRTKYFKLPKQFDMLPNKGAQAIVEKYATNHKIMVLEFSKILAPLWPGSIVTLLDGSKKTDLCVSEFYCALLKTGPVSKIKFYHSDLLT